MGQIENFYNEEWSYCSQYSLIINTHEWNFINVAYFINIFLLLQICENITNVHMNWVMNSLKYSRAVRLGCWMVSKRFQDHLSLSSGNWRIISDVQIDIYHIQ